MLSRHESLKKGMPNEVVRTNSVDDFKSKLVKMCDGILDQKLKKKAVLDSRSFLRSAKIY